MKVFCLFLLLGAALCIPARADCGAPPKVGTFLSYKVEPKPGEGSLSLDVTVSFRLSGTQTKLTLPSEWRGVKNLYKAIAGLQVSSPGAILRDTKEAWVKRLTFPLGKIVQLRYSVVKDWSSEINADSYWRVMLDPTFFQVTGPNFLVYPEVSEDKDLPLFLEWWNLPPGWTIVDSFAGGGACQSATTRLAKLRDGLFAGGLLRISQTDIEGKTVFIAMRGKWDFKDESFVDLAEKIVSVERKFWKDPGPPNYLITLSLSDDINGNDGGAALEDSFAMFEGPEAKLNFATRFMIAHEMFHAWNTEKLGELQAGSVPYWFIEGFTDYYARTLLLKAQLVSEQEYTDDVRKAHQEYYLSGELRRAKGKEVQERFYSDPQGAARQAYLRGDFLALCWNSEIKQRSGGKQSLEDAMFDLLRLAQHREIFLTDDFLSKHFEKYVGSSAVEDVKKYIEDGEDMKKYIEDGDTIPSAAKTPESSGGPAH